MLRKTKQPFSSLNFAFQILKVLFNIFSVRYLLMLYLFVLSTSPQGHHSIHYVKVMAALQTVVKPG